MNNSIAGYENQPLNLEPRAKEAAPTKGKTNQAFARTSRVGNGAQRIVTQALEARQKEYKLIDGKDELQAFGDIQLLGAKGAPAFVEVKAGANYDDSKKWYNVYFELAEYYQESYSFNPRKARTVEVVGFCKNLAQEPRTIYAHKLGSFNRWLVYTPQSALAYFLGRETVWGRDLIPSRADQDSKGKVGLRLLNLHPDKLKSDWPRSQASKYFTIINDAGLVGAIGKALVSYDDFIDGDPVASFRDLAITYKGEDRLKRQYPWWFYPTAARSL